MGEHMNRRTLAEYVATETELSYREAYHAVNVMLDGIVDAVGREERVTLSNFGSFHTPTHRSREARNPRTGEPVQIPARPRFCFRPSPQIQSALARRATPSARKRGKGEA